MTSPSPDHPHPKAARRSAASAYSALAAILPAGSPSQSPTLHSPQPARRRGKLADLYKTIATAAGTGSPLDRPPGEDS